MATQRVLFELPAMADVSLRGNLPFHFHTDGALVMDVYAPPARTRQAPSGVVVFVSGYPDPGMERMLGRKFKDMHAYATWARLVAASGMVAVTYTNIDPVADLRHLLAHLRDQSAHLGIDARRVGLWACSGNVPNALAALVQDQPLACAVLAYGYMFDDENNHAVAEAAAQFRFANPAAGLSVSDIAADTALLVVRAGADQMPGLNTSIDAFAAGAVAHNRRLTLMNLPGAPHAFDLVHDSIETRIVIEAMLAFLSSHLNSQL